jgi:hypothetical protein
VALSDEFMLKTHPFFARLLHELGCGRHAAPRWPGGAEAGIQSANVPFCAPMRLFHGIAASLAETGADRVFIPRIRGLPQPNEEVVTLNCPVVQASPDVVAWDLRGKLGGRLLAPALDFGREGFEGKTLRAACRVLSKELEVTGGRLRLAFRAAAGEQRRSKHDVAGSGTSAGDLNGAGPAGGRAGAQLHHPRRRPQLQRAGHPAPAGLGGHPARLLDAPAENADFGGIYWVFGRHVLRVAHESAKRGSMGCFTPSRAVRTASASTSLRT